MSTVNRNFDASLDGSNLGRAENAAEFLLLSDSDLEGVNGSGFGHWLWGKVKAAAAVLVKAIVIVLTTPKHT